MFSALPYTHMRWKTQCIHTNFRRFIIPLYVSKDQMGIGGDDSCGVAHTKNIYSKLTKDGILSFVFKGL